MSELIVYDLEYTSWPGAQARHWSGPGEFREIVQIGAVRVDRVFRPLDSLDLLVLPRRNPRLSAYFTDLTGITQDELDRHGRDAVEALDRLDAFSAGLPLLANGTDAEILAENCRLLGRDNPFDGRTRDVHAQLLTASCRDHLISADLPEIFGLARAGRGHNALADAHNVAAALALIVQSSSKAFL